MKKRILFTGLLAGFILFAGCASQRYYTPASMETVRMLEIGMTTPEDLLLLTGDPDSIVKLRDGTVVYTWLDTVFYTRGLSAFPLWMIGGSKRSSSETHYLEVRFRNGRMTGHRYLSTLPLDDEEIFLEASGDCDPGLNPATAPQLQQTEGKRP